MVQAAKTPKRRMSLTIIATGALLLSAMPAAGVDLAGHWRVDVPALPLRILDVSQLGDNVTIQVAPTIALQGTIAGPGSFTLMGALTSYQGRLLAGATVMDGRGIEFPPIPPSVGRFMLSRCECFDGNSAAGDGCDTVCQVEPCFTCAGDPSVCTPSPDGAACDDRRDCTAGETCAAGGCGGGVPVPACIDLSGPWHTRAEIQGFGVVEQDESITQRNGVLRFATTADVGTIDTATGAFELGRPLGSPSALVNCPAFVFDVITGTAGESTFSATGTVTAVTPTACLAFALTLTGTRITCGTGTLEPGETCDDGNRSAGDGCDASCQVEPCFACSGMPSVCAPTPGASCDDGRTCTTGDTCGAGGVCAGTPRPDGTSCDADGDVCTGVASCQAGTCQPAPPPTCGACARCDALAGCVAAPRLTCTGATNGRRTTLAIRNSADDTRDTIAFRWIYGPGGPTPVSFGDPRNTDDYGLCIFDASTPAPALVFRAVAPAGGTCAGRPCWGGSFTAPSYRDKEATPDGLTALRLKGGTDRAKASVKGKGALLSSRPLGLPGLPLPLPLLVQLQNVRGGCVEARFDGAGVTKNDPLKGRFKASTTP